jgi:hypothetical protein
LSPSPRPTSPTTECSTTIILPFAHFFTNCWHWHKWTLCCPWFIGIVAFACLT